MYNRFSICIMYIFFVVCNLHGEIDKNYVQTHTHKFEAYLKDLRNSMRLSTGIIKNSMRLMGYAQQEIDAVPIAFPFIYDKKYKTVWSDLKQDEFIIEANNLLLKLNPTVEQSTNKDERRKKAHELIHTWNCEKMSLPAETTTKDLAQLVEKRQINLDQFFHYQLIQFFVKYHLNI